MLPSQLFSRAQKGSSLASGNRRFCCVSVALPLFSQVDLAKTHQRAAATHSCSLEGDPPPRVCRGGLPRTQGPPLSAQPSRVFLCFSFTEFLDPFQRVIQPEEIWLYKNPLVQSDNIPTRLMFVSTLISPLI